jgi:hypothetical protein
MQVNLIGTLRLVLKQLVIDAQNAAIDLPERQYVTVGGSIYDCEQVTVSGNIIQAGEAGQYHAAARPMALYNCEGGWHVAMDVAIVRRSCNVLTGRRANTVPSIDAIESDAERASADVDLLVNMAQGFAGGAELGEVPANVLLGEAAGGMFVVRMALTLNLWEPPA